jgi:uncharacterized repeat protein (TIGR03803 family)
MQASDGNFYIAEPNGGNFPACGAGCGSIFKMTPAGIVTKVYQFSGGSDGAQPLTGLVEGGDGSLYGVATAGGSTTDCQDSSPKGCGTVFKITPTGELSVLYTFSGVEGSYPTSLILGSNGNFYFVSGDYDDSADKGGIFELTSGGQLKKLYSFADETNGGLPSGLIQGTDGNLYGSTGEGGDLSECENYGCGTLYRLTPGGELTVLYTLNGGSEPAAPTGLAEGEDGNFYGQSERSGNSPNGQIFKVTPAGDFTSLYTVDISSNLSDAGLLAASDGNFYGVTPFGGAPLHGTIYQITPGGKFSTLYTFAAGSDGATPIATLAQGSDGSLYGTNTLYGADHWGVFFKYALSPALPAPVQLTLSAGNVTAGNPVTLDWKVLNAFSLTMQQCYAFVQGGSSSAGNWTGQQAGNYSGGVYAGSATFTPVAEGTYTYALTCGGVESGFATLTVGEPAPLVISTSSLSDGTVSIQYSATLAATGGIAPYSWSITSGSLPPGLSVGPSTGVIQGMPTAVGDYSFTVQVQDSSPTPVMTTSSLSINVPLVVLANPGSVTVSAPGGSGATTLSVLGGTSPTFTCSGLPAASTCTVSNLSGGGSANNYVWTATLTIGTTGAAKLVAPMRPDQGPRILMALALPGCFALGGWVLPLRVKRWGRRKSLHSLCCLMVLLVAVAAMTACGSKTSNPGTPTGTSTVTVTATAGSNTATTTVKLTVQ